MKKLSMIGILVGAAVLCAAPISLHQSQDKGVSFSVDKAQARIGRPLTPGSIAGVNRRHNRRAGYYYHGAPLQLSLPWRLLQLSVPRRLLSLPQQRPLLQSSGLLSSPLSLLVAPDGY